MATIDDVYSRVVKLARDVLTYERVAADGDAATAGLAPSRQQLLTNIQEAEGRLAVVMEDLIFLHRKVDLILQHLGIATDQPAP
jgi:hypothetical protein